MKPRAQLDHALIHVDFTDKPKIKSLLGEFGEYGIHAQFFVIKMILALSRATNAEMTISAAKGIAWELRIESKADAIIEYCFKEGIFFRVGEDKLSNDMVAEDQEKLAADRANWRRKKPGRKASADEEGDAQLELPSPTPSPGDSPETSPVPSPENTPGNPLVSVKSESEDLKDLIPDPEGGSGGKPPDLPELTPAHLKTDPVRAALRRYQTARRRRWRHALDDVSLEALLMDYVRRTEQELVDNLNYSAQGSYKTVVEKPLPEKERIEIATTAKAKQAAAAVERPRPVALKRELPKLTDDGRRAALELMKNAGIGGGAK